MLLHRLPIDSPITHFFPPPYPNGNKTVSASSPHILSPQTVPGFCRHCLHRHCSIWAMSMTFPLQSTQVGRSAPLRLCSMTSMTTDSLGPLSLGHSFLGPFWDLVQVLGLSPTPFCIFPVSQFQFSS